MHVPNIEKLMKYCSELGSIIGYPYFFNWSTATNHRDTTPDGKMVDITYAMFRVGKYDKLIDVPEGYTTDRRMPVEKTIIFGPVYTIVDKFMGLTLLTKDKGVVITSFDDVKSNADVIRKCIDEYIT